MAKHEGKHRLPKMHDHVYKFMGYDLGMKMNRWECDCGDSIWVEVGVDPNS